MKCLNVFHQISSWGLENEQKFIKTVHNEELNYLSFINYTDVQSNCEE